MLNFSIVIPLYNKEKYIQQALNSIKSQTMQDFEVLIVNDGCTDFSIDVVKTWIAGLDSIEKPKYMVINQDNQGVSAARNVGCENAKNSYVAFLDADDYWENNHLATLAQLIELYGDMVDLFSSGVKQSCCGKMLYPNLGQYNNFVGILDYFQVSLLSSGFVNSSSVCVSRKAVLNNLFPINMKNFEDVITWARIANHKGMAFCSVRSAVQVIDGSEASRKIDFKNYIKYEKFLRDICCDKALLNKYQRRIFLRSMLNAKLQMPCVEYYKQMISVFGESKLITIYSIIGMFCPKGILSYLRNTRKKVANSAL